MDGSKVTLRGTVDNLKAKHAAAENARNTVGVSAVDNRINVRLVEPRSDDEIEKDLNKAIRRDPYLETYEINESELF